jgi:hypothetical protein
MVKIEGVKMNNIDQAEQRSRFEQSMRDSGYVSDKGVISYLALAQDIILNLPNDISITSQDSQDEAILKARKRCAVVLRELAVGKISPLYADTERGGQMRPLAIEVATLLNVPVEYLFEGALAEVKLDRLNQFNAFSKFCDTDGHDQDKGLIAKDIVDLCRTSFSEEQTDLLSAFFIEGLDTPELMERFRCTSARLNFNLGKIKTKLDFLGGRESTLSGYSNDPAEYFHGYDPQP